MRIEVQAIKLELKIRGDPYKHQGGVLEYVRGLYKPKKQPKLKQVAAYGDSFVRNYSRSY